MAHSSLVAALSPVMGQVAAAAMATAAMNKSSSSTAGGGGASSAAAAALAPAAPRISMDLGGPVGGGSGPATVAALGNTPVSLNLGGGGGGGAAPSSAGGPGAEDNQYGSGSMDYPEYDEGMDEDDEDYEDEGPGGSGGVQRRQRSAFRASGGGQPGALAPSTVMPGGKPTLRGKSQYRGVSWCEKVRSGGGILIITISFSYPPHYRHLCWTTAIQVKKWRALLWNGQKQLFLGHFSSDTDAARAYDKALIDLKV